MAELSSAERDDLGKSSFAFVRQRKLPLEDANHVRNAIARFNQVEGVSDSERDDAWKKVQDAAERFGVDLKEKSWREIGKS